MAECRIWLTIKTTSVDTYYDIRSLTLIVLTKWKKKTAQRKVLLGGWWKNPPTPYNSFWWSHFSNLSGWESHSQTISSWYLGVQQHYLGFNCATFKHKICFKLIGKVSYKLYMGPDYNSYIWYCKSRIRFYMAVQLRCVIHPAHFKPCPSSPTPIWWSYSQLYDHNITAWQTVLGNVITLKLLLT